MNIGQKTILLLNISRSDARCLSAFVCGNVSYIKACDLSDALEKMRSARIDLVLTDTLSREQLLKSTEDDSALSSVPVVSIERSFAPSAEISDCEKLKNKLFESGSLFRVLRSIYPLAVTCNLSNDSCRIIQYEDYSKNIDKNISVFSELVASSAALAAPAHRANLMDTLAVSNLCSSIERGDGTVRVTYRSLGNDGCWHWFETIVLNIENPYDSDILAIVLSRIVDEQKNLEERLLRTLDETTEELEKKRYYEKFANDALPVAIVMYYLDWRPMPYMNGNLFLLMGYSAEEVAEMHKNGLRGMVTEEDLTNANAILRKASDDGIDRVTLEYRMFKKDGSIARVQEIASRFVDEDGSVGFISVFTDITERYLILEQLHRNERIMSIVGEHSERIVYYYDLASDELRAINTEDAISGGLVDYCVNPYDTLSEYSLIHSESKKPLGDMLSSIRSGVSSGSAKLHMTCVDGTDRWFDTCFTVMPDESGSPLGAVISMLDITDQHDREISHARYMDSIDNALSNRSVFFEFDLSSDFVEKQIGVIEPFTESFINKTFTETVEYLTKNISKKKQQRRVNAYLSKEMLLDAYNSSQRRISDDWPITLDDGQKIWIHCSVQLVKDPYTEHIKLLMTLSDVTESMQIQLNILQKAENDGLTGLYNRSTIEHKIRDSLEADYRNSVFILLDLDDLKYINDSLGHAQGDRAICAISDELIATFKGIGMEGRLGGDEFLVFIPNLPESMNLDDIISNLLRRLTSIKIGENDDNALHCSIGIALADEFAHDFSSLYKRADIALYHVKHNGKNDYTYFSPEMLKEDFRYCPYKKISYKNELFENIEFRRMMNSLAVFYPQILLSNLSKNAMFILASAEGFSNALPSEGTIDNFMEVAAQIIHPESREEIIPAVSRDALLSAYKNGRNYLYFHCRITDDDNGNPRWIAFIIVFYKNADGDICELALMRWANEKPLQRNASRLQTAADLSLSTGVKLVCAVNPSSGTYEIIAGSFDGIPSEGSFDTAISPLCGLSVSDIENRLHDVPQLLTPFANSTQALFAHTEDHGKEIIMTVFC